MTYAQLYLKQLEVLDEQASKATVFSDTRVSEHTKSASLEKYEKKAEELGKKYGLKKVLLEEKGILRNYRYEFSDGSSYVSEW